MFASQRNTKMAASPDPRLCALQREIKRLQARQDVIEALLERVSLRIEFALLALGVKTEAEEVQERVN